MADNYRTSANRPCRGIMHKVQRGDTLYKLSRRYNVRVSAIMLANPYMNIYNLQPGDEICIPRVGPVRPTTPIQIIKPERPVPPVKPVPPIGTVPPVKPVPPIGTVPPVKPVPPIGTVPPVKPVPPIGTVPPVTPVPPVGDLRPPTTIQPRDAVETMSEEKKDTIDRYDTIDYAYEKFRASLEPDKQAAEASVVEMAEEQEEAVMEETVEQEITTAETEAAETEEEQVVESASVDGSDEFSVMLDHLSGSLDTFNKYMKEYLQRRES